MTDTELVQLAKKISELDVRLTAIEEFLGSFSPSRTFPHGDTPDVLYPDAVELAQLHEMVSASLLQRRLAIGYARAARILDELEDNGIIEKGEGAKPRKVLIKKQS